MNTPRKAREQGKLDQFAADHEADAPGDAALRLATGPRSWRLATYWLN